MGTGHRKMLGNGEINRLHKANRKNYMHMRYEESAFPKFRNGPVPGTGRLWYHRSSFHYPHVRNELRESAVPEYKELIRAKRNNTTLKSISYYYEKDKRSRSWKDCSKCRRQWGKKKQRKSRKNAVYVCKTESRYKAHDQCGMKNTEAEYLYD